MTEKTKTARYIDGAFEEYVKATNEFERLSDMYIKSLCEDPEDPMLSSIKVSLKAAKENQEYYKNLITEFVYTKENEEQLEETANFFFTD